MKKSFQISLALLGCLVFTSFAADAPRPLRALLVLGGCCHDYAHQKDILKKGIEERANITVDIVYTDDRSTKPPVPIYGNPDYAKGYDIVIHDECAAAINDPEVIKGVLAPHRAGIPGVNLHCAMHCYRIGNPGTKAEAGSERSMWFDYLGLQSSGHGPQEPIALSFIQKSHPIITGMEDWTTIKEEHYNNVQIFPTATPLAHGKQTVKGRDGASKENDFVVAWANDYHGARVFSTTIGHNNQTVSDDRYLNLVTRGVLWACDKLGQDGKPKAGYEAPKK